MLQCLHLSFNLYLGMNQNGHSAIDFVYARYKQRITGGHHKAGVERDRKDLFGESQRTKWLLRNGLRFDVE